MDHSRKLLPPMVSSAVALIAVTNYCVISLLNTSGSLARDVMPSVLSIGLPASVAVVLVMSTLYHALQDTMVESDSRRLELLEKAQRDALTGVASRDYFEERLADCIDTLERSRECFAVIMLDLDHFKRVNDLHGHQMGDELLKQVATRLSSQLRPADTVARLGGDEYVIIRTAPVTNADVKALCSRICSELERPYEIGNLQVRASASVGAVIADEVPQGPYDYLRAADLALYDAKARGRNCYRFYSPELDDRLRRRDQLETDLRHAIQSDEDIDVQFQPQIDANGELTGVEALFRWKHPQLGDIPASEAIEIAEESELILLVGDFVFRRAAAFAREYPDLSVALNLSPAQFARCSDLAARMRRLARKERVSPTQLELEITERLFMEIGNASESQIQALRQDGFRVALDDFGTGYSSLSYLRRFQVDRLKLDKSFAETCEMQDSITIMRAAVGLAHLLGLEVVAEGIETGDQESIALESGCDVLQGHRYAYPMTEHEFRKYRLAKDRDAA